MGQKNTSEAWMNEDVKSPQLSPEEIQQRQQMLEKMTKEDEEHENNLLSPKRIVKSAILQGFTSEIISEEEFKVIMAKLPPDCAKTTWIKLFCDAKDGKSFTTFYNSITFKGPLVVIIKDKQGHVFGGFASPNIDLEEKDFYGDMASFLFSIKPEPQTYMSTGLNHNFVYLNIDKRRHKPMCFAMGGSNDFSRFSIRVNEDLSEGSSDEAISTFNCPTLSGKKQFEIEKIEVWGFAGLEVKKRVVKPKNFKITDEERVSANFLLQSAGIIKG